jgi:hypothetical protein
VVARSYDITYRYEVDGKVYNSDLVTFMTNEVNVSYYVRQYWVRKKVTVYYSPNDPSFAVLEPDKKLDFGFIWWRIIFPYVVLAGVTVLSMISAITVTPRRRIRPEYSSSAK